MKKVWLIIAIVIAVLAASPVMAKNSYSNQKSLDVGIGFLLPADAKGGWQPHLYFMKKVDQAFSYGGGLDIYTRNFEEKALVQSATTPSGSFFTYETNAEYTMLMLTPQFLLKAEFNYPNSSWRPFVRAGLGLDLLFSTEEVFTPDSLQVSDSRFYWGVAGVVDAGATFKLGDHTRLGGLIGYQWGTPRRSASQITGLPVHEEINMGGLRIKLELNITYNL